MANQRIDKNLTRCGYSNRSQFIRDAIIEKLSRMGIELAKEASLAPARTDKYPSQESSSQALNDLPIDGRKDSKLKAAGSRLIKKQSTLQS